MPCDVTDPGQVRNVAGAAVERWGGQGALSGDLKELCESRNISDDGTLVAPSDNLEAVAVRH